MPSQPCSAIARHSVDVERVAALGVRPDPRRRREVVEERPRTVAQRELVVGEVEVHAARSLAQPALTPDVRAPIAGGGTSRRR